MKNLFKRARTQAERQYDDLPIEMGDELRRIFKENEYAADARFARWQIVGVFEDWKRLYPVPEKDRFTVFLKAAGLIY